MPAGGGIQMKHILSVLDDDPVVERASFFSRQFRPGRTKSQVIFDVVFGVVGPILCFTADPIVFKSSWLGLGEALFSEYQLFAYLVSTLANSHIDSLALFR
jgi:hypothetical protein